MIIASQKKLHVQYCSNQYKLLTYVRYLEDIYCLQSFIVYNQYEWNQSTKFSDLEDLEEFYFSPEYVEVTFKGTFQPQVTWIVNDVEYNAVTNTNLVIPTEPAPSWTANSITFRINTVTQAAYDTFTLKAQLSFTEAETTEDLETRLATIYKRGFLDNNSGEELGVIILVL